MKSISVDKKAYYNTTRFSFLCKSKEDIAVRKEVIQWINERDHNVIY